MSVCPSAAVRMGASGCRWAHGGKQAQASTEEMRGERRT